MDCSRDWGMCDETAQECCAKLYPDDTCGADATGTRACSLASESGNIKRWK